MRIEILQWIGYSLSWNSLMLAEPLAHEILPEITWNEPLIQLHSMEL